MKLAYQNLGEGRNILILHGLFGMSDNWLTIGRRLARDYNVYLIDQRNHGRSPHVPEHNYQAMADDLAEFADEHQLESFTLIGHSMGGKTALHFGERYPQFLSHLIMVDIGLRAYRHGYFRAFTDAMMHLDLAAITTRKDADSALSDKIPNPAIRQFLLKNLERTADHRFQWRFNLPVISESLEMMMQAYHPQNPFKGKALFLRGGRSDYILPDDIAEIRRHFPQAEFATIPNTGHWLHAEAPDEFIRQIAEFLQT